MAVIVAAAVGAYAWHQTAELRGARSELAEVEGKAQNLAADLHSARARLEAEKAHSERLGTELQSAREQVALLNALRRPPTETATGAISIREICAVPEQYGGRIIAIRGPVVGPVNFSEPTTHFRLFENNCLVHCVFNTRELDPDTRRMLQSVADKQPLHVIGRLVPDKESPYRGMKTHSGYQFVVSTAERAK